MPRHDHAFFKATFQSHGTTRHGHGMCELASSVRRWHVGDLPASGYHADFREGCYQKHTNPLNCRTTRSDISGYHADLGEGYQKHTNPLNCRTTSSDISGYHADFHEGHGTVGEWQGRVMACVN
jgi:hypothetical protein